MGLRLDLLPGRVLGVDQSLLLGSAPLLELLFATYRVFHLWVLLDIYEFGHVVAVCEAGNGVCLVFVQSAGDIVGHADVEDALQHVREDVDVIAVRVHDAPCDREVVAASIRLEEPICTRG